MKVETEGVGFGAMDEGFGNVRADAMDVLVHILSSKPSVRPWTRASATCAPTPWTSWT